MASPVSLTQARSGEAKPVIRILTGNQIPCPTCHGLGEIQPTAATIAWAWCPTCEGCGIVAVVRL